MVMSRASFFYRKGCVHQPLSVQATIFPQTHTLPVEHACGTPIPKLCLLEPGQELSPAARWFAVVVSTPPLPSSAGCPSRYTSCLYVSQAPFESCGIRNTANLYGNTFAACCWYTYARNIYLQLPIPSFEVYHQPLVHSGHHHHHPLGPSHHPHPLG